MLSASCQEAQGCTRCPELVRSRTQVVFGAGGPHARVMLVAEAPGRAEDAAGVPLAGEPAAVLQELLDAAGIGAEDVFVTNVVLCRPPDNRSPTPNEVSRCEPWLARQVELVRPVVVCPLGNFATKRLRGESTPVTRLHGQAEIREIGGRAVHVVPLLHPSAALYDRANREHLRADIAALPALLALGPPPQPQPEAPEPEPEPASPAGEAGDERLPGQLGLF